MGAAAVSVTTPDTWDAVVEGAALQEPLGDVPVVGPGGVGDPLLADVRAPHPRPGDLRERFASMSVETLGGPPEVFARYIDAELKRWGEVVRAANIKVE